MPDGGRWTHERDQRLNTRAEERAASREGGTATCPGAAATGTLPRIGATMAMPFSSRARALTAPDAFPYTPSMRGTSARIEGLDLLRLAAACGVMLYHYGFLAGAADPALRAGGLAPIAFFGIYGVDVFFVVSGFVIATSTDGRSAGAFLAARLLRLVPAFALCAGLAALSRVALDGMPAGAAFGAWLANLTFFPRTFGQDYLDGVYWTLNVEVRFYIGVALLVLVGAWRRGRVAIALGWLALAALHALAWPVPIVAKSLLLGFAAPFAAGILLHRLVEERFDPLALAGLLLAGIVEAHSAGAYVAWANAAHGLRLPPWAGAAVAPAIIGLAAGAILWRRTPLPPGFVALAGATSYTLYLLHGALGARLLHALAGRMNAPAAMLVTMALMIALGAAVAALAEPVLRRGMKRAMVAATPRRFALRRSRPASPAEAA